ncbi:MAG TPA: efflux RND transporter periplasmic adaptor subunit [Rhodanobacteraceae bacterium]|nr:efflux RND transporter periplasmic adaptor subunit [Rhodanobacteraceae bacterium]
MSRFLTCGVGSMALALVLGACSHTAPPASSAPTVGVVSVNASTVPLTKNLVGRLSAFRSANVLARVAGVLLKRDYKEGSEVKAGQLLFQIDPAPFKAALANAQGQLAQAQAAYTNAQFNAKQAQALAPKGYISKTALENALATERTTAAAVQAARANVETARINLGYTTVTSPIAGRAGEQLVTEGALVGQGTATPLTTVDQLNPLYVNFTISMTELDELRQAQQAGGVTLSQPNQATVKISLPDGTPYPELGTVDFSSPSVDAATGSVNLRAVVPNPQFSLLPGAYVTLQLNLGERHHVYLVPQAAVQTDIAGTYVLIVGKDGKVTHDPVTTSGTSGVDWVVTSGLRDGDRVIVSGIQVVQVGQPAKATPWQPPAAAGTSAGGAATASASTADAE